MKYNKKVLTVKEIQSILQISQKTAYNLVRQALTAGDMFKVIKIGGVYRIPTEPFLDWLDQMD
jgi:predicted DNA-binding transcriptional regulator AlpA